MKPALGLLLVCLLALPGGAQETVVPVMPQGVNRDTRRAIDKALKFLAREQAPEGYWRSGGGYGDYPVAMTSLAALAIESGCEWITTDGDYARFAGLSWSRPF